MKLSIILSLAVGVAIVSKATYPDDPVSKERPISDWILELKPQDANVRAKAANSLGDIGRKAQSALPALLESLKDRDTHVRVSAAFALWKIDGNAKVAVPVLVKAMKDPEYDARVNVPAYL